MATLEELLAEDGFKKRHKPKRVLRGAPSLPSQRLEPSCSRIRPVRSRSDVNPRRHLSALTEKGGLAEPRLSNAVGRTVWSMQEPDGRLFDYLKESPEFEGSSGKNCWRGRFTEDSVKSKSLMAKDSLNGKFDDRQMNFGCNRRYEKKFIESKEQNGKKAQNLQAKCSFKDVKDVCPIPEVEGGSLEAIISMINSCVNQLIKDESFRLSLNQACVSSLKSSSPQNKPPEANGVIYTLKESIRDVERIIIEGVHELELKKTSFKLSVITGIKSMESDDGQTCGIPNSHLAACGHLYLSILYKIQKKEKFSAKHLLQVFCNSPYQARTALLPGLWDKLFLPSLSHLKSWYDKEVESIPINPHLMMKLEFLEKVYNDIVDMGTSQVAACYKAWLMEDKKGPAFPSISIPFASVPDIVEDANEVVSFESCSSSNSVPSKTMISKRLYESVLGQVKRNVIIHDTEIWKEGGEDELGDEAGEVKINVWGRKYDDDMHKDNKSLYAAAENSLEYCGTGSHDLATSSEENYLTGENYLFSSSQGIPEARETKVGCQAVQFPQDMKKYFSVGKCYPQENENEHKLKKLAQAAFQSKITNLACTKLVADETETTVGPVGSCSLEKKSRDIFLDNHEEKDQGSLYSRIPEEFICPLTGQLLKDPVTLESGHTFELAAIQERFNQGNRTCPITGQLLNSSPIPGTNTVLKRMINQWMEECFRSSISHAS